MRWRTPVLRRELVDALRARRAFLLLAVFLAAPAGLILLAWPRSLTLDPATSRSIFDLFFLGELLLLGAAAPILSAPAIGSERERGTLDLLLTAPLGPFAIAGGKLLSAVAYLFLLLVCSLPLFFVCFLLGGVGPREVAGAFALLFAAGLLGGALGLALSAWMERSQSALAVALVVLLPLLAGVALLQPLRAGAGWALFTAGGMLAAAGALFGATLLRLHRPFDTVPRAAEEEAKEEQLGLVLDRRRVPDRWLFPGGTGRPLPERARPLREKELRYELFGRGTLLMRILVQGSLVAALPFFIAGLALDRLDLYGGYMLVFVALLAPSLTAGIFTLERERRTLDLLLTTPLDDAQILHDKLAVALRTIGLLAALLFALLAVLWALGAALPEPLAALERTGLFALTAGPVLLVSATAVLGVFVSAFCSLVCRTTLRAMTLSYAALALLFVVPAAGEAILDRFGEAPGWVAALARVSPFRALHALYPSPLPAPEGATNDAPLAMDALTFGTHLAFSLALCALLYALLRRLFHPFCRLHHEREKSADA